MEAGKQFLRAKQTLMLRIPPKLDLMWWTAS